MEVATKKELIQKMEKMTNGLKLVLKLGETFGAGTVIIELNPTYPQKGQKKYLMRWAKTETEARSADPLLTSDKAKSIAGWAADRSAEWLAPAV